MPRSKKRKPEKVGKKKKPKAGRLFEQAVASVVREMTPEARVTEGEWVDGPDGRRDRDVWVEAVIDGHPIRILIECKDYDPTKTGKVDIGIVDALDSKRPDLGATGAMIFSNAGFTEQAMKKAARKGILLRNVMRQGDSRIRVPVYDTIYTRRITALLIRDARFHLPDGAVLPESRHDPSWHGSPLSKWLYHIAALAIGANPVVRGQFCQIVNFVSPLDFDFDGEVAMVDGIAFVIEFEGVWLRHQVRLDASVAWYDPARKVFRIPPGPQQIHLADLDTLKGGEYVKNPPPDELAWSGWSKIPRVLLPGEFGLADMAFTAFANVPIGTANQELEACVKPEDLDFTMPQELIHEMTGGKAVVDSVAAP